MRYNRNKIMNLKYLVVGAFIFCHCLNSIGQNKVDLPDGVAQQAQKRIDTGIHLGTIIGIIDKNGTRYYSFGQMSLNDNSKPDENSLFEIASITKPYTTSLLADLELSGAMKIDAPVQEYLPIFNEVKSKRVIALLDLINHTSGLPRNPDNTTTDDSNRYRDYTVEMLSQYLSGYKIRSKKRYLYSNLAYVVLEHALELKMNETYEELLQNRVLDELGMMDTYFTVPDKERHRLVTPYRDGKHVTPIDMGKFPAGGGIIASAKDMLRFLEAQLGLYSTKLDSALKITHKQRFSDEKQTLGLAWKILKREESGKTILFHKGGSNGFSSFAGFDVENQIGVVVLTSGAHYFSDLGFKILDDTYPLYDPEE
ncbi:MAG: serine hydrolase domain-containing protein [Bacteroidota bacterium]